MNYIKYYYLIYSVTNLLQKVELSHTSASKVYIWLINNSLINKISKFIMIINLLTDNLS